MNIVGSILMWALQIYSFIVLARVLMTWLPNLDYSNPIVRFLYQATEPVLKPIRDRLPPMQGMDFRTVTTPGQPHDMTPAHIRDILLGQQAFAMVLDEMHNAPEGLAQRLRQLLRGAYALSLVLESVED